MAIVCVGKHPLSHGLGWGENHVPSDGRESMEVRIPLATNELRYWDEGSWAFVLEKGPVEIMVGSSSADIRLRDTLEIL